MSIQVSGLEPDVQINCPACKTPVGQVREAVTAEQPEPQPVHAGELMRPSYPGKGLPVHRGPGHLTGRKAVIVGLVVGGVILAVVVAAAAYGMMGAGVDPDGEWHHHVSKTGQYEVDFPEQPRVFTESATSPVGDREFTRAECATDNFKFQVSFFRLGDAGYDYDEAAKALAEESNAILKPGSKSRTVGEYEGRVYSMKPPRRRATTVLLLRRDDFVYIVLCENYPAG
jgi:hypothetical protein